MLYYDSVARTEEEAVNLALKKMRLDRKDAIVRSVTEVPEGVKVRVEAVNSRGREVNDLLEELFDRLGVKADLFYIESFDKILVNVSGPYLGLIIGKGGSTLEALEILVSAMHNRGYMSYKPVVINPGGYRENKKKALNSLVRRACETAATGEKVNLPLMKQRDRKQVHQIIKDFPGFRSRSFGDGLDRRVCIYCATESDNAGDSDEEETLFIVPDQYSVDEDVLSDSRLAP
ncbi:MAG: KH domain-containing protein [bacterium]|nr:KH domain-containing protein [bacterium]